MDILCAHCVLKPLSIDRLSLPLPFALSGFFSHWCHYYSCCIHHNTWYQCSQVIDPKYPKYHLDGTFFALGWIFFWFHCTLVILLFQYLGYEFLLLFESVTVGVKERNRSSSQKFTSHPIIAGFVNLVFCGWIESFIQVCKQFCLHDF